MIHRPFSLPPLGSERVQRGEPPLRHITPLVPLMPRQPWSSHPSPDKPGRGRGHPLGELAL